MTVVGTGLIEEFCRRNQRAKKAFDKWLPKVEEAFWSKRLDAKATFPAADPKTGDSGTEYLILDIGGNKYRLVVRPVFKTQTLIIMAVMTHAEYSASRWKIRTMNTINKLNPNAVPTTFEALIGELMPTAIHDEAAYGNAMEMVRRLAVVPAFNHDQTRYLDTLCVLVAAFEKTHRTVGKAKLKPLEVLQGFVAEHRMQVRELGTLLGVSEPAAATILTGERTLTLDQVRKLAERFQVGTALFVG